MKLIKILISLTLLLQPFYLASVNDVTDYYRPGTVHELRSLADFDILLATVPFIVFDFHASWCGPCKTFAPIFAKAAQQHRDIIFVKVDIDTFPSLAERLNIKTIPTLFYYSHGQQRVRHTGRATAQQITQTINNLQEK